MSGTTKILPIRLMRKLLLTFARYRLAELNRRGRRNFTEVIDTLGEYFEDRGVEAVDLRRGAVGQPRKGIVPLERVLALLDDFEDDCLIREVDAEPEFIRRAEYIVRDLTRWLRGQVVSGARPAA